MSETICCDDTGFRCAWCDKYWSVEDLREFLKKAGAEIEAEPLTPTTEVGGGYVACEVDRS